MILRTIFLILLLLGGYLYVRLNQLNQKPLNVENFNTYELGEIYVIGLAMAIIGYPVSPEASLEHLDLMTPKAPDTEKTFSSDFIETSEELKAKVKGLCLRGGVQRLWWSMSTYNLGFNLESLSTVRLALALNGAEVTCDGNVAQIKVIVNYPKQAIATFVTIGSKPILQVQEGLFNILEERGWYYPFSALYQIEL